MDNQFEISLKNLEKMSPSDIKALLDNCNNSINEIKIVLNHGGSNKKYFEECLDVLKIFKTLLSTSLSLKLWKTFGINDPRTYIENQIKKKS